MELQEKTCWQKDQANYLNQSMSGSEVIDWNFQSVKYLDKLLQQYGGRKSRGQEAEFQERIRKEWACLHGGGSLWVSDSIASPYLKVAGPTRKIQSLSKLWQFRKWRAEIQNILLGLTGMGTLENSILSVDFLRSSNDLS